jgi:hypothetical protein
MPVTTRSNRPLSSVPHTRRKRCKVGTRKNKQGVCDISKCQKELNQLRTSLHSLFPKIDKIQEKVAKMGDTDMKKKAD